MRYCKLGINGKILNIIQVADTDCQDADGEFDNNIGIQFLENLTKWALWTPILEDSKGQAQIGEKWDDDNKVFVSRQPYPSWTFNNSTGEWDAPTPNPEPNNEENPYLWHEESQTWFQK